MTWCNFDKQRLKQWISKHEIQFHIQTLMNSEKRADKMTILHLQENIILFPFFSKCHVKNTLCNFPPFIGCIHKAQ